LSTATLGVLPRTNSAGFAMDAFLLHSLSTAIIARILGRKLHVAEREIFDYFLSGLLHDFGKIVFAHFMPREFQRALVMARDTGVHLYEAEREILTADHTQIGARLGEKWRLPARIVACLRNHHGHAGDPSPITDAVIAADQISKELKIGYGGENIIEVLSTGISERFGADMEGIIASLGDVHAEIEKALIFIQP
jgi:HD-like signal output (HDOD) protein